VSFNLKKFQIQLPWYSIYEVVNETSHQFWGWLYDAPPRKEDGAPPSGTSKDDGPEPTTVDELVAGTPAEPKSNVIHVDFKTRKKAPIVDAVIEDEKEPA
jgi:hypothetical protein